MIAMRVNAFSFRRAVMKRGVGWPLPLTSARRYQQDNGTHSGSSQTSPPGSRYRSFVPKRAKVLREEATPSPPAPPAAAATATAAAAKEEATAAAPSSSAISPSAKTFASSLPPVPDSTPQAVESYFTSLLRTHRSVRHFRTQQEVTDAALIFLKDLLPVMLEPTATTGSATDQHPQLYWTPTMALSALRVCSAFGLPLDTLPVLSGAIACLSLDSPTVEGSDKATAAGSRLSSSAEDIPAEELGKGALLVARLLAREEANHKIAERLLQREGWLGLGGESGVGHTDVAATTASTAPSAAAKAFTPVTHPDTGLEDDLMTTTTERPLMLFYRPALNAGGSGCSGSVAEKLRQAFHDGLLPRLYHRFAQRCDCPEEAVWDRSGLEELSVTMLSLQRAVTAGHITSSTSDEGLSHQLLTFPLASKGPGQSLVSQKKITLPSFLRCLRAGVSAVSRVCETSLHRHQHASSAQHPGEEKGTKGSSDTTATASVSSRFRRGNTASGSTSASPSAPQRTGVPNVNHDMVYGILNFITHDGVRRTLFDTSSDSTATRSASSQSEDEGHSLWKEVNELTIELLQCYVASIPYMRTWNLSSFTSVYWRLVKASSTSSSSPSSSLPSWHLQALSRRLTEGKGHLTSRPHCSIHYDVVVKGVCQQAMRILPHFSSSDAAAFLKSLSGMVNTYREVSAQSHGAGQHQQLVQRVVLGVVDMMEERGYFPVRAPCVLYHYGTDGSLAAASRTIPRAVAKEAGHGALSPLSRRVLTAEECCTVHLALTHLLPVLPQRWLALVWSVVQDNGVDCAPQRCLHQLVATALDYPLYCPGVSMLLRVIQDEIRRIAPSALHQHQPQAAVPPVPHEQLQHYKAWCSVLHPRVMEGEEASGLALWVANAEMLASQPTKRWGCPKKSGGPAPAGEGYSEAALRMLRVLRCGRVIHMTVDGLEAACEAGLSTFLVSQSHLSADPHNSQNSTTQEEVLFVLSLVLVSRWVLVKLVDPRYADRHRRLSDTRVTHAAMVHCTAKALFSHLINLPMTASEATAATSASGLSTMALLVLGNAVHQVEEMSQKWNHRLQSMGAAPHSLLKTITGLSSSSACPDHLLTVLRMAAAPLPSTIEMFLRRAVATAAEHHTATNSMTSIAQFFFPPLSLGLHTRELRLHYQQHCRLPTWLFELVYQKAWMKKRMSTSAMTELLSLPAAAASAVLQPQLFSERAREEEEEGTHKSGFTLLWERLQRDAEGPYLLVQLSAALKAMALTITMATTPEEAESCRQAILGSLTDDGVHSIFVKQLSMTLTSSNGASSSSVLGWEDIIQLVGVLLELQCLLVSSSSGSPAPLLEDFIRTCMEVLHPYLTDMELPSSTAYSRSSMPSTTHLLSSLSHTPQPSSSSPEFRLCRSYVLVDMLVEPYLVAMAEAVRWGYRRSRREEFQQEESERRRGSQWRLLVAPIPDEMLRCLALLRPSLLPTVLNSQLDGRGRTHYKLKSTYVAKKASSRRGEGDMTPLDCLLQVLLQTQSQFDAEVAVTATTLPMSEQRSSSSSDMNDTSVATPPSLTTATSPSEELVLRALQHIASLPQLKQEAKGTGAVTDNGSDDDETGALSRSGRRSSFTAISPRLQRIHLCRNVSHSLSSLRAMRHITPDLLARLSAVLDSVPLMSLSRRLQRQMMQFVFVLFLRPLVDEATSGLRITVSGQHSIALDEQQPQITYRSQSVLHWDTAAVPAVTSYMSEDLELLLPNVSLSTWRWILSGVPNLSIVWMASHRFGDGLYSSPYHNTTTTVGATSTAGRSPRPRDGSLPRAADWKAVRDIRFYHSGFLTLSFLTATHLAVIRHSLGPLSLLQLGVEVLQYYTSQWVGRDEREGVLLDEERLMEKQHLITIMRTWRPQDDAESEEDWQRVLGQLPSPPWRKRRGTADKGESRELPSDYSASRGLRLWYEVTTELLMECQSPSSLADLAKEESEAQQRFEQHRRALVNLSSSTSSSSPQQVSTSVSTDHSRGKSGAAAVVDLGVLVEAVRQLETVFMEGVVVSQVPTLLLHLEREEEHTITDASEGPPQPSRSTEFVLSFLNAALTAGAEHGLQLKNVCAVLNYWPAPIQPLYEEQQRLLEAGVLQSVCCGDGSAEAKSNEAERSVLARLDGSSFHPKDVAAMIVMLCSYMTDGPTCSLLQWLEVPASQTHHTTVASTPLPLPPLQLLGGLQAMLSVLTDSLSLLAAEDIVRSTESCLAVLRRLQLDSTTTTSGAKALSNPLLHLQADVRRYLTAIPVLCANDVERFELLELALLFTALFTPFIQMAESGNPGTLSFSAAAAHSLVSSAAVRGLSDALMLARNLEGTTAYEQHLEWEKALLIEASRQIDSSSSAEEWWVPQVKAYASHLLCGLPSSINFHRTEICSPLIPSSQTVSKTSDVLYLLRLLAVMEAVLRAAEGR